MNNDTFVENQLLLSCAEYIAISNETYTDYESS